MARLVTPEKSQAQTFGFPLHVNEKEVIGGDPARTARGYLGSFRET